MQAIIPAAGMGRRLGDLTRNRPKCMVRINGITLIERILRQLDLLNLSRIIIITGWEEQQLIDFIRTLDIATPLVYINNPIFDSTNNIYSLSLASDYLIAEDTLIVESDLIIEDSVLQELINDPCDTLALVDKYESWMDGTVVKINDSMEITDIVSGSDMDFFEEHYYKTVNIYKFSKNFSESLYVPFLKAYLCALGNNRYYEQVLRVITVLDDWVIKAKKLAGQIWYEIDNLQDIDIAESLFEPSLAKRLQLVQQRYGGFWRYPKLLDFCYLVNPFFPPIKMIDELQCNLQRLISSYPSGMGVNSLLAAKKYDVNPDHIVIGNGATELIKALAEITDCNTGVIYPTFEEYPTRVNKKTVFVPKTPDFAYTADDVIKHFNDTDAQMIVIINPDNPTGNYIPKADLIRLIEWAKLRETKIVIDESFVDFSFDYPFTLIDEGFLQKYPNLTVVKSISKSYGIPGLRLGVLASCDKSLISAIKKSISIWNINSIGEFYMQIEEKYAKDYESSLTLLNQTREKFIDDLNKTGMLRTLPTQADFIAVQVINGMTAAAVTELLFAKANVLVKDLSTKEVFAGRQYLRIAVRSNEDNDKLICALKDIASNLNNLL